MSKPGVNRLLCAHSQASRFTDVDYIQWLHGTARHGTCVRISSIVRRRRLTLVVVVYTIDRGNWLSTAQSSADFRSVSSFVTNDKTASLGVCVLDRMFSSFSVSPRQLQLMPSWSPSVRCVIMIIILIIITRNTFCGTWYLPHSQVHNDRTVCSCNSGYTAYFHCAWAKRPYFHFRSKIWRHRRVVFLDHDFL